MCNIAGYSGTERAAPRLLAMMEAQEGFCAGFYTGIATVADGKLHWAKTVGDTATLRRTTNAADLPGTTGIIHSRPDLGGGYAWAHPFVDVPERFAYLANGHRGFFDRPESNKKWLEILGAEGRPFLSRDERYGADTELALDKVHGSEFTCRLIEHFYDLDPDPAQALRKALLENPGEVAVLLVDRSTPDCIHALRISQPMMAARDAGGIYLASTAMAFPAEPMDWQAPVPPNSLVRAGGGKLEVTPLHPSPGRVADLFPWSEGEQVILDTLRAKPEGCRIADLKNATAPLWPKTAAPQKDMMVYEIVRHLRDQRKVTLKKVRVPGLEPDTTAPRQLVLLLDP